MGLAPVDDWTKPRNTRASIQEREYLGLLALQGRGGAKPGSPAQGIVFLGSRVVDGEVFTSWRGLICAVVCFSPITNEACSYVVSGRGWHLLCSVAHSFREKVVGGCFCCEWGGVISSDKVMVY